MPQRPEPKFRSSCGKKFREQGAEFTPIESSSTENGIPDAYLAYKGLLSWIEFKAEPELEWPNNVKLAFRPGQRGWLTRNADQGGWSFVCIKYANGVLLLHVYDTDEETKRPIKEGKSLLFMKRFDAALALEWMKRFHL